MRNGDFLGFNAEVAKGTRRAQRERGWRRDDFMRNGNFLGFNAEGAKGTQRAQR